MESRTKPTTTIPASTGPAIPPEPPATPRPITPIARTRSWTEPSIRVWWLLAVAILLLIAIYAIDRLWSWGAQNKLIRDGVPISAKVIEANGLNIANQRQQPNSPVTIEFDWHGKPQRAQGTLDDRTDYIVIDQSVPIRVDPNDPNNWTARTQAEPLGHALFLGLALLPLPPILIALAAMKRKGILQTWQTGEATVGIVVDRSQTPIAPRSYRVRCSLRDRRDKRILTVFMPRAGGGLHKNDLVWLVLPRIKSGKPIAVAWFE